MDLKTLLSLPVDKLRAEAAKIEGLEGIKNMDRKQLITVIAKANNIKLPEGVGYTEEGLKKKALVSALKAKRKAKVKDGKFDEARVCRAQMKRALRDMNA